MRLDGKSIRVHVQPRVDLFRAESNPEHAWSHLGEDLQHRTTYVFVNEDWGASRWRGRRKWRHRKPHADKDFLKREPWIGFTMFHKDQDSDKRPQHEMIKDA